MFYKVIYDDTKDDFSVDNPEFLLYNGKYVKVIIREKTNPYLFDKFIEKIEEQNPAQIQVVDDNFYLDMENDEDILSEAEDTLTILTKYVDSMDVSADKKQLNSFIGELYNSAVNYTQ